LGLGALRALAPIYYSNIYEKPEPVGKNGFTSSTLFLGRTMLHRGAATFWFERTFFEALASCYNNLRSWGGLSLALAP